MNEFRLLKKAELVQILGRSKSTIDRMIAAGKFIKATHDGPRWRSDIVQAWIVDQTKAA